MAVTIWHNPKCATSRKVLEMIRQKGVEPEIIEYVKTPPTGIDMHVMPVGAGVGVGGTF